MDSVLANNDFASSARAYQEKQRTWRKNLGLDPRHDTEVRWTAISTEAILELPNTLGLNAVRVIDHPYPRPTQVAIAHGQKFGYDFVAIKACAMPHQFGGGAVLSTSQEMALRKNQPDPLLPILDHGTHVTSDKSSVEYVVTPYLDDPWFTIDRVNYEDNEPHRVTWFKRMLPQLVAFHDLGVTTNDVRSTDPNVPFKTTEERFRDEFSKVQRTLTQFGVLSPEQSSQYLQSLRDVSKLNRVLHGDATPANFFWHPEQNQGRLFDPYGAVHGNPESDVAITIAAAGDQTFAPALLRTAETLLPPSYDRSLLRTNTARALVLSGGFRYKDLTAMAQGATRATSNTDRLAFMTDLFGKAQEIQGWLEPARRLGLFGDQNVEFPQVTVDNLEKAMEATDLGGR